MNSRQQFQQNTQVGSGLTRYRSAPSSYFASLLSNPSSDDGFGADDLEQLFNPRASSPETQVIFSRFMNGTDTVQQNTPLPLLPPRKVETEEYQPQQLQRQHSNDYSSASYPSHNSVAATDSASAAVGNSYNGVFSSFNSNCSAPAQPNMDRAGAASSGLIRHSSSPAGLFANINIENGRLMNRMDFSSMHPISEIGSKGMGENAAEDAQFDEDHGNDVDYITGLPIKSWDDSPLLSDHYLKGVSNDQKNEGANRPKTLLSHHLSLPNTSAELSAMEKLLQDSVPCKTRAKRGCATHPRSIAERVRRTKISERMRKLQELVPNMEKQTNTSDMLDLAVDYIKELQKHVKTLSDNQAKCNCSAKQQQQRA